MSEHKIRIAIIGGGETGTSLLNNFMKYKFIEIIGVADFDENSPGMKIARESGIFTTNDFLDIAKLDDKVDVIVDAIGKEVIRNGIRTYLHATSNKTTIVMPELISLMIDAIMNNYEDIHPGKHGFQRY